MAVSKRALRNASATLIASTSIAGIAPADVIDATWLGGNSTWYNASLWSIGSVPNNSGPTTYRASIPSGSIDTAQSFPKPGITLDSLQIAQPAYLQSLGTLTVNNDLLVDGNLFVAGSVNLGASASLHGSGTVIVGRNGSVTTGYLTSTDSLTIPIGLNIQIGGDSSRVGSSGAPFVNQGYIFGGTQFINYRCAVAGSTINNLGIIEARAGVIAFGGTFTRAGLGNLVWTSGGTFGISGTLINDNQTLVIDAAHPWELDGGKIQGGTLQIQSGSSLNIPLPYGSGYGGTLDGVAINGQITHYGAGNLDIKSGLVLGTADIFLGSGALEAPSRLITSGATLTIGSTAFVHGGGRGSSPLGLASGIGNGLSGLVNQGTIGTETGSYLNPEFDLLGTSILNNGTFDVGTSCFMYASGAGTTPTNCKFADGSSLHLVLDGSQVPFQVKGVLDLSSLSDYLLVNGAKTGAPFTIITASGGIIGQFNFATPGYRLSYTSTQVIARSVPEPTPFFVVASLTLASMTLTRDLGRQRRANVKA